MTKSAFLFLPFFFILFSCNDENKNIDPDKEEWISLFNGKDLTGWDIKFSGYELNHNYKNTFQVEDSMMRIKYDEYQQFDDAYAHIYYEKPFSYYKIRFDYRFTGEQTKGGATWNVRNSGIMFHSQSAASNDFDQDFPVSIELQLLGGLGEGERNTANLCTPGTAVEYNGAVDYRHCINSASKTYDGDQWVHVQAVVLAEQSIAHIVEGDTVLVYQKPQIGGGFISKTEGQSDWLNFGVVASKDKWEALEGTTLKEGYIALQAESHPIDFKNIELLNLCGCMDPKAKNYKSYYVKEDRQSCVY